MSFFDYPIDADTSGAAQVFLADASERDWADLLALADRRLFAAGETVIGTGDTSRSLYLVLDGTLEVLQTGGRLSRSRRIATVGSGSVIGEVAFFDGAARSAEVKAMTAGEVAELTPSDISALASRRPELACAVLLDLGRILAQRLRALQETS
jgi:CRP/FNR family transcriptional regulator, cyclic AMP receptor protein